MFFSFACINLILLVGNSNIHAKNFLEPEVCRESSREKTFFLSTPRSGVNLITCSLQVITRKPTGIFPNKVSERLNRLDLEYTYGCPFLYRYHPPVDKQDIPSNFTRLIFLTRNPKELLFRDFTPSKKAEINEGNIKRNLERYIAQFKMFEEWSDQSKLLLFYEDVIEDLDGTLLNILSFTGEEPTFMEDYIEGKDLYLKSILANYKAQFPVHGGRSSERGPSAIRYTEGKDPELLKHIDSVIKEMSSEIYEKYLTRFETK